MRTAFGVPLPGPSGSIRYHITVTLIQTFSLTLALTLTVTLNMTITLALTPTLNLTQWRVGTIFSRKSTARCTLVNHGAQVSTANEYKCPTNFTNKRRLDTKAWVRVTVRVRGC
jgi:hypothetical protein